MWCSYSNVVIPKHATPCHKAVVPSVSASSLPRHRRRQDVSKNHHHVGELGQAVIANIQSNPTPISKPQQEEEGEQISGSDILWALQRASARKNLKMKIKNNKEEPGRGSSPETSRMEESAVDYTNVRPLCINSHWAPKLDELEKRLRELSDTI